MQLDLNCIISQQFTNMLMLFTVATDIAIVTLLVSVIDHEILTAIHLLGYYSNFENVIHNLWRNWMVWCKGQFTHCQQ